MFELMTKDKNSIYERIAANIRYLRAVYEMSQEELAKRAKVSASMIAKMETNIRDGRLDMLETIAVEGFGIRLSGLLEIDLKNAVEKEIDKYKIEK